MPGFVESAKALVRLDAWNKAAASPAWGFDSKRMERPLVAIAQVGKGKGKGAPRARLMLFPGFPALRDFEMFSRDSNWDAFFCEEDVPHWELRVGADRAFGVFVCRPGHLPEPVKASDEAAPVLASVFHETTGLFMRLEDDPELFLRPFRAGKTFVRREGLDGKWRDGETTPPALPLPRERIVLEENACAKAAKFPLAADARWEVDCRLVPVRLASRKRPLRAVSFFGVMDGRSGAFVSRAALAVPELKNPAVLDPDFETAALRMTWETLALRLLGAIVAVGVVPGVVAVSSPRMMRMLRPLGLQLPFRLMQTEKLSAFDAALKGLLEKGSL